MFAKISINNPAPRPQGRIVKMKLTPIGSNQTEIERSNGTKILYSYKMPVAAFVPGKGARALVTKTQYSTTTSRHINKAVARWGATRHNVGQAEIDKLAG